MVSGCVMYGHAEGEGVGGRAYVVNTTVAVGGGGLSVTHQAVRPYPIDMLHRAPRLREHDVAKTGIVGGGGAVGDGEVLARGVAGEEDGDVVDLARAVGGIRRQRQLSVGRHVERDLDGLCDRGNNGLVSVVQPRLGGKRERGRPTGGYEPPPSGVPGWGLSTMAKPGVNIWPPASVKF